jgi:2-oxoisovalerate dehydrogenase E1 component alpha subunit
MYGNANDVVLGRQMPDHVTAKSVCFGSVTAPIGTQITQAVGFAWAAKLKREDVVSGTYFGDGATSSNDFHSALTFAGVFQTPTLFFLRNNGWAISVPASKQTNARTFADKGVGYGVPAVRCDGNDALAVFAVTRAATDLAARGGGPTLIELITYRAGAHSTSDDPTAYRDKGEVERQQKRDPIRRLRKYLERISGWSDAEEEAYLAEITEELRACIERAESTPLPPISSMFEQVFEQMPEHLVEQQRECVQGPRAKKSH